MIPKPNKDHPYPHFRPISILSNISKVFERIVHSRLQNYITQNQNLPAHELGFHQAPAKTAQFVRVVEHSTHKFQASGHTTGIFLDVQKAFNKV